MGEKFLEIAKHALLGKQLPEGKVESMMEYLSQLGPAGLEEQYDGTAATCLMLDANPKVQHRLVHILATILEGLDGRRASAYPILEFPGPVPGIDEVSGMLLDTPCLFGIFDPGAVKQVVDLEIDRLQFFRCPYAQQLDPVWTAVITPPIVARDASEASTQILMAQLVDTLATKIPFANVSRNNLDTLERFDATISFSQVTLIFGEEKRANSKQSPSTELSTKSTPKHSTLPYFFMRSAQAIPGVVQLKGLFETDKHRPVMQLTPVGHTGDTCTDEERFHGLAQVITTAKLLHIQKIVHNDLRWENTILDGDQWFIIDFDDATYLDSEGKTDPTPRHKKFRRDTHAPEIAVKHDHKVDVWALGRMILQLSVQCVPVSLKQLAHATQCQDANQRPALDALLDAIEETHPAKRQRH
eukprot:TRINITY_DN3507_c0_g1_i1.p1 TRINITY_DN3507_c0_g1~~TRINITY_DN3507_c0_g1_i1.p1  ORF type:complete len:414 (+),score=57.12 TRINITY_DN3507_c0_g1_i1:724-1965(+)